MITDFHSHVLPDMDDGAKDVEQSLAILRKMKESGVDRVMLTPHFYRRHEDATSFLKRRAKAAGILGDAIRKEENAKEPAEQEKLALNPFYGIGGEGSSFPILRLGAEIAFGARTAEEPDLDLLCYTGTKALLIEMPFSPWTEFEYEALAHISLDRGFDIVLAHVERYPEVQEESEIFERIEGLPLLMQVNAEALLPMFKRKKWVSMFEEGRVKLLGSDCHGLDHRPPNLREGRDVLLKKAGADILFFLDEQGDRLLGME